ncbi:flavin reductase family protein [Bradyrhizobium sp. NP1]|uniref:flavin reductase family protein n=1 Tax=Bradyrhizobium sp. NP1 TaxID=3049772 RepID=UPI0025A60D06|nr:flavin reductase family protein [Bradyrhizobium sp. NP1]WJR75826.1 flavin reductase family protein [Bradyrhizobium sp. NP1]
MKIERTGDRVLGMHFQNEAQNVGVDSSTFKGVMRKLTGAVCVVGVGGPDGLHGMTATAICSASADPPTLLIILNKTSRTHAFVEGSCAFSVSVLGASQEGLAELFASKKMNPFEAVPHKLVDGRTPVLSEAIAYLLCELETRIDVHTHTIFVGRVVDTGVEQKDPLLYFDGAYRRLAS